MATKKKQDIHIANNNRNVNNNTVHVNVESTSSKGKGEKFQESFAEGMGGEMGKRTGTIVILVIIVSLGLLFGWFSMAYDGADSNDNSGNTTIIKEPGTNGNIQ